MKKFVPFAFLAVTQLIFAAMFVLSVASPEVTLAQEQPPPVQPPPVVVEQQADLSEVYKNRRSRHGVLFSVVLEQFYPVDFYSMFRDVYIEKIIGTTPIQLVGVELGYKLNLQYGSLAVLGSYVGGTAQGEVDIDNNTSTATIGRDLSLSRAALSLNYAADTLLSEPWIVPYGQIGLHQFEIEETDYQTVPKKTKSTKTSLSLHYRVGLLFQLNWIEKAIDPNTQVDGIRSTGLQNTFIDVFATTHLSSSKVYDPEDSNSTGDPDLSTGLDLGVGLKLEF